MFMQYALTLAARGVGNVSPNPMVGAVIVHDGVIIGQGWHEKYGTAHAEVNAIESVINPELLKYSTMYVTLEPCSHWGKTPPCCDLIISKNIPRVVVGCVDPYHEVQGNGLKRLKSADVEVITGVLEAECLELNKRFIKSKTTGIPYIVLKWAQTADGLLDVSRQQGSRPIWITGTACKKLVHQWRSEEDAIMVGTKTVIMDNPTLTAREVSGRNPVRITFDRELVLNSTYNIFNNEAETILITSQENRENAIAKFSANTHVQVEGIDYSIATLPQVLTILSRRNLNSLFVEGGRELLQSFIDSQLWDEARIFTSPLSSRELYPNSDYADGVYAPEIPTKTHERHSEIEGVELTTIF